MFESDDFEFMDENIVETDNIPQAMRDHAKEKKLNLANLDFTLLEYTTLFKEGSQEWQPLSDTVLKDDKTLEEIARSEVELKQHYKISIHTKVKSSSFRPDISLFADKFRSALQATVKKTSDLHYFEGVDEKLREELLKKQILQGALIGIFNKEFEPKLMELTLKLKTERKLISDFTFLLCSFPRPVPNRKDLIIFHHLEKEDESEVTEAHTQQRRPENMYAAVEKGECIVEYRKAKDGKNGRSFLGEVLRPTPIQAANKPKFETTDNVEVQEDDDCIKYISKINGYVIMDALLLDVTDTLSVQRVTFKETGDIEGEDETTVKISEDRAIYDGIDSGVVVEGDHIELQGSIAGGAVIRAKLAEVHGHTHKTSKIFAQKAKIKLHRGYLKAQQAMVNRLEHGQIDGISVKINENMGGLVRAKKVYINNLTSNIKVFATELIDIREISGEGNVLTIDPSVIEVMKTKKKEAIDPQIRIDTLKHEIKAIRRDFDSKTVQFKRKSTEVNAQVMQYKKMNTSLPAFLKTTLAKHQAEAKEIEKMHAQVQAKETEIRKLEETLKQTQKSNTVAKVVCHGHWPPGNKILFKVLKPQRTIEYLPKSDDKTIRLIQDENNEYHVQARPI